MEERKAAIQGVNVQSLTPAELRRQATARQLRADPASALPSSQPSSGGLLGGILSPPPSGPSSAGALARLLAQGVAPSQPSSGGVLGGLLPAAPPAPLKEGLLGRLLSSSPTPTENPYSGYLSGLTGPELLSPNSTRQGIAAALMGTAGQQRPTDVPVFSASQLGQVVRGARERMGLNQQQFADLAGVGRRFLSELENGKSTSEIGLVLQVCRAAGIDVITRSRI